MILAIIGRPNVGKSTLFNRLVGKKIAIVDDVPGVTRDWKKLPAKLWDISFEIIDTAGLLGFESDLLASQIEQQTIDIIQKTDALLFMVDGKRGVTNTDLEIINKIRKVYKKPVVTIVNKCEKNETLNSLSDFYKMGLGEPVAISAAHAIGIDDLYVALKKLNNGIVSVDSNIKISEKTKPLSIAIVGRPNVGKSTLINSLINDNRLLTGDQPGITRDTISTNFIYHGRDIKIIDTAGMRRKSKIIENLEKLSVSESVKAIQYAEIVILVTDSQNPMEKQDLTIASQVINEGRGLIIAVNKSDLKSGNWHEELQKRLELVLPQVKKIPCIAISAFHKKNLDKLLDAVFVIEKLWNTRISTSVLNEWLNYVISKHPAPIAGGSRIRIKYITQIKTRPPTFILFISKPAKLLDSYLRYLLNRLREDFKLDGVPIRFQVKKGKNPYDN